MNLLFLGIIPVGSIYSIVQPTGIAQVLALRVSAGVHR